MAGLRSDRVLVPLSFQLDWSPLTAEENRRLEEESTDDLLFDSSRVGINFWFHNSCEGGWLDIFRGTRGVALKCCRTARVRISEKKITNRARSA